MNRLSITHNARYSTQSHDFIINCLSLLLGFLLSVFMIIAVYHKILYLRYSRSVTFILLTIIAIDRALSLLLEFSNQVNNSLPIILLFLPTSLSVITAIIKYLLSL